MYLGSVITGCIVVIVTSTVAVAVVGVDGTAVCCYCCCYIAINPNRGKLGAPLHSCVEGEVRFLIPPPAPSAGLFKTGRCNLYLSLCFNIACSTGEYK